MKNHSFRSLVVPFAAAIALGAVACSQEVGADSGAASSSEALGTRACSIQTNATAPASGTATFVAHASQYAATACRAFAIDVSRSSSVHVTASLPGGDALTAAQCASLVADLRLVENDVSAIDCSDLPPPCKPHVTFSSYVLGEARVGGTMVNTPTGRICEIPAAVLTQSWTAGADMASVKLLASVSQAGKYDDVVLTVTTH